VGKQWLSDGLQDSVVKYEQNIFTLGQTHTARHGPSTVKLSAEILIARHHGGEFPIQTKFPRNWRRREAASSKSKNQSALLVDQVDERPFESPW
jgi:hypothetical protein